MVDELEQVLDAASISEDDLDSDEYQVMNADEVLDEIIENASKCLMQTSLIDDSDYSALVETCKGFEDVKVDLEANQMSDTVSATVYTSNFEAAKSTAENLDTEGIDYSLKEHEDNYRVKFR